MAAPRPCIEAMSRGDAEGIAFGADGGMIRHSAVGRDGRREVTNLGRAFHIRWCCVIHIDYFHGFHAGEPICQDGDDNDIFAFEMVSLDQCAGVPTSSVARRIAVLQRRWRERVLLREKREWAVVAEHVLPGSTIRVRTLMPGSHAL